MERIKQLLREPFLQEESDAQLVWVCCMAAFVVIILIGAALLEKKKKNG